jgi:hypothetical protein
MNRPIGVIVVAILLMFTGVVKIGIGLDAAGITSFGFGEVATNAGLTASVAIIAGLLTLIAAFGLFTFAGWAWYLAIIVLIFRVTADVFALISYSATSVAGGASIGDLVFSVLVLWYFYRPNVKAAFKL